MTSARIGIIGLGADVFIGVMPFFFAMILTLALIILFPQIALWLPESAR